MIIFKKEEVILLKRRLVERYKRIMVVVYLLYMYVKKLVVEEGVRSKCFLLGGVIEFVGGSISCFVISVIIDLYCDF